MHNISNTILMPFAVPVKVIHQYSLYSYVITPSSKSVSFVKLSILSYQYLVVLPILFSVFIPAIKKIKNLFWVLTKHKFVDIILKYFQEDIAEWSRW